MPSALWDVARHVGVSIKTVSNVVRGSDCRPILVPIGATHQTRLDMGLGSQVLGENKTALNNEDGKFGSCSTREATTGFEPVIRVLQTQHPVACYQPEKIRPLPFRVRVSSPDV